MENQIFLQLGDIIRITSLKNEKYNNKLFFIKYISNDIIEIINKNNTYQLTIENNKLTDESISKIEILHRSKKIGFSEQNKLLVNTWVDIYFNGDVPMVITGLITSKEEDMIELKLYPNNELIYLDFAYKGIDPKLNIEKIVIRKNSPLKISEEEEEKDEVSKEEMIEDIIEENNEEYFIPNKINKVDIQEINNNVKNIILGEELGIISQSIKVNSQEERYGIEIQTNDLLNNMIAKVDDISSRKLKIKEIKKNITRFEELRKIYSEFDEFGNPTTFKKKGYLHKPLFKKFKNLEQIEWILPVVELKNKLYDIDSSESENQDDIESYETNENLLNIMGEQNKYENNIKEGDENNFKFRTSNIINYLKPFEENKSENSLNMEVFNDIDCLVNNTGEYYSSVASSIKSAKSKDSKDSNNKLTNYKNKIQRVNKGVLRTLDINEKVSNEKYYNLNYYINNDEIKLKSIMFLPNIFIEQSKMYLPNSNIFEKALINQAYISKEDYINNTNKIKEYFIELNTPRYEIGEEVFYITNNNNNKKMYNGKIKDIITENYPDLFYIIEVKIDGNLQETQTTSQNLLKKIDYDLNNINNFNFNGNDINTLLETIVPKSINLINKIDLNKNDELTIYNICKKMEPFGIYENNLTFMFYKALVSVIIKNRKEYIQNIVDKNNEYLLYINTVKRFNIKQVDKYEEEKNIYGYKQSDHEFINNILNNDGGELLNLNNVKNNFDLFNHSNLENMQTYFNSKLANSKVKENKKCIPKIIAKEYYNINVLEQDNDKEIYFDKERDDIVYDILEVYSKEKMEMSNDEFKQFLIKKLQEINGLDDLNAIKTATSLMEGRKKVEENHYAIYYHILDDKDDKDEKVKSNYYKRKKNIWVLDTSVEDEEYIDYVEPNNCNNQEACIKIEDDCETLDTMNKKYVKNMIKKLLVSFDHVYYGKKKLVETEINEEYDKKNVELKKKLIINEKRKLYFNTHMKNISNLNKIEFQNFEKSPNYDLLQKILGIDDYSKKQEYLINFIDKYTRTPSKNENQYMLYCKDSDNELIPNFMKTIASSYLKNENMEYVYDEICKNQGRISEDGDSWVDEHSGYVIKKIHFDNVDLYDDNGFKVKRLFLDNNDNDDTDLENDVDNDLFLNSMYDFIKEEEKNVEIYENEDTKFIVLIIEKIRDSINLTIEKNIVDLIIYVSYNIYKNNYYVKDISSSNRKKSLTVLTICTFTTYLQMYNKTIKINRVIPGCNASFEGFPLNKNNDTSLLEYISCIVKNLSKDSTKNNPFKLYSNFENNKIVGSLKKYIENDVLTNNFVQQNIQKESENINSFEIEDKYSKWDGFLPPLDKYFMKIVKPLPSNFIDKIKNKLKSKDNISHDLLIIQSKIIELSLGIQYSLQKVIERQNPILKTKSNNVFLENSCCSKDNTDVILYFIEKDTNLKNYLEMINSYKKILDDLKLLNKVSHYSYLDKNETIDKSKKQIDNNYKFSEDLIYKSFIKHCRWENNNLKDTDLINICGLKDLEFNKKDNIKDKIDKIKNENINLTQTMLQELLKKVRKKNLIVLNYTKEDLDKVSKIVSIFNDETMNHDSLDPLKIIINSYNNEYIKEINSGKKHDYTKNDIDTINILDELNKSKINDIIDYLKHIKLKRKEKEIIKTTLNECILINTDDSSYKQSNNFGIKVINNIISIYPNLLKNKNKINTYVHKHWNLAKDHQKQIKDIINNSIEDLYKLQDATNNNIIEIIDKVLKYSEIYKNICNYLPMNYKDNSKLSFFSGEILNKILHYLILTIFKMYIDSSVELSEQLEYDDVIEIQKNVANMIHTFIIKIKDEKLIVNFDNNKLVKKVKKTKEKEKQKIKDRLEIISKNKELADTERIKKKHKLGPDWSKGLQKSLTSYDTENFTQESSEIIGDQNINVYLMAELNENDYIGHIDSDFNEGGLDEMD